MKHAMPSRRSRNRGNSNTNASSNRRAPSYNRVYDSNGPDVRIRGTAHQICEKYMALSKDALSSGDRVLAESYLQHAEHYQRIIVSIQDSQSVQRGMGASKREVEREEGRDSCDSNDLSLPANLLKPPVYHSTTEHEKNRVVHSSEMENA